MLKTSSTSYIAARFLRGVSWSAVGFVLSKLFTLLTAVYLSRLIGKASYGELGVIQSTTGLFGIFAGAGLGLAATRFIASCRGAEADRIPRILGLIIACACIFTVVTVLFILLFAETIAAQWLNNANLVYALRISCLLLVTNVGFEICSSILAGFEEFKSNSLAEILRGLVILPIALLLAPQYRLTGAIAAFIVASLAGTVFLLGSVAKKLSQCGLVVDFTKAPSEMAVVTRFSLPSFISSSLSIPVVWFSTALLAHLPNGYEELGIYNAANQLRLVIMMIPIMLSRVLVPLLAKEYQVENIARFNRAVEGANFATIMLILPVSVLLLFAGESVMAIFGKDFSQGWRTLVLIVAGTSVSAIGAVIGSTVIATGNMWAGALQNLIWSVAYIVAVLLQYRQLGSLGLASSFLFAHIVLLYITVCFLISRRLIGREMARNIIVATLLIVVASLIVLIMPVTLRLATALPVFALIFLVSFKWLIPQDVEVYLQNRFGKDDTL